MRKTLSGIYHYCGHKSCSWNEFAKKIFEQAKIKGMACPDKLNSILSDSYITKAVRPKYSVLDCCKIESEFMVQASDWHHGIISAIDKIKKNTEL
jgi:dTDP-4-dehydrorhamnose reductase